MCGMGRTGTLHAWQQEGIRGPDVQMIGKSLGGGFIPISGVLVHQKIFDAVATPSGALAGGHTFQVSLSYDIDPLHSMNKGQTINTERNYRHTLLPAQRL